MISTVAPRVRLRLLIVAGVAIATATAWLPAPFQAPEQSLLWVPSGIALAIALIFGRSAFVAIAGGFFIGLWSLGVGSPAALGLSLSQALAAVLTARLLASAASGPRAFEHPRHMALFVGLVALVAAPIGALGGVLILSPLAQLAAPVTTSDALAAASRLAASWYANDLSAYVLLSPALTLWLLHPRVQLAARGGERRSTERRWQRWRDLSAREDLALGATSLVAAPVIFTGGFTAGGTVAPLFALPFPILTWAALRFGARATASVLFVFAGVAAWSWHQGMNPFAPLAGSVRMLHLFLLLSGTTALLIAAASEHRRLVDSKMHGRAVTDPLTGLPNYHHLTGDIERLIRSAGRNHQPLALLLIDVDELKAVNDALGHRAGSDILVRVANALRASCRATDLVARYGGDEFAVVLPACAEADAEAKATAIQALLAADPDYPPVAISIGLSVCPEDGTSGDLLFDHADEALYEMKDRRKMARA